MILIDKVVTTTLKYLDYVDIVSDEYLRIIEDAFVKIIRLSKDSKTGYQYGYLVRPMNKFNTGKMISKKGTKLYYIRMLTAFDFINIESLELAYTDYFSKVKLKDIKRDIKREFDRHKVFCGWDDFGYMENNDMILRWDFKKNTLCLIQILSDDTQRLIWRMT